MFPLNPSGFFKLSSNKIFLPSEKLLKMSADDETVVSQIEAEVVKTKSSRKNDLHFFLSKAKNDFFSFFEKKCFFRFTRVWLINWKLNYNMLISHRV